MNSTAIIINSSLKHVHTNRFKKFIYIYIFGCFVTLKKLKIFCSATVEIFVQLAVDFFSCYLTHMFTS